METIENEFICEDNNTKIIEVRDHDRERIYFAFNFKSDETEVEVRTTLTDLRKAFESFGYKLF